MNPPYLSKQRADSNMDTMSYQDKKTLIELGLRQSDEMIMTAADLLRCYPGSKLPRAAKEVIALFAGQAALRDDRIIANVSSKVLSLARRCPAALLLGPHVDRYQSLRVSAAYSPIQVVLEPRNERVTDAIGVGPTFASAHPGTTRISLYPVVFSPRGQEWRQTLDNINVTDGTYAGDLERGMPQLLTHERTHCFLYTRDLAYGWDRCVVPANWDGSGPDPLENADSVSAIIFFLWCLISKPEWDFSTGIARWRGPIPYWITLFRTGFIQEDPEDVQPTEMEPRIIHLRNRDVVWRL